MQLDQVEIVFFYAVSRKYWVRDALFFPILHGV
jgi:hypothetical protein